MGVESRLVGYCRVSFVMLLALPSPINLLLSLLHTVYAVSLFFFPHAPFLFYSHFPSPFRFIFFSADSFSNMLQESFISRKKMLRVSGVSDLLILFLSFSFLLLFFLSFSFFISPPSLPLCKAPIIVALFL